MGYFLLINDNFGIIYFNNTITNDYFTSAALKMQIRIFLIFCLLIAEKCLIILKIDNYFEYILIFLILILGIFLLCSSDDLVSAY